MDDSAVSLPPQRPGEGRAASEQAALIERQAARIAELEGRCGEPTGQTSRNYNMPPSRDQKLGRSSVKKSKGEAAAHRARARRGRSAPRRMRRSNGWPPRARTAPPTFRGKFRPAAIATITSTSRRSHRW